LNYEFLILNYFHARLIIDGNIRGATQVPFSGDLLYDLSPDRKSLFVYWSEDNHITELDVITFDTLRTIDIRLPQENINSSEIDSLKDLYSTEQWNTLKKMLPSEKAFAEEMIIDQKGRFWMKSNIMGNYQKWFVLDRDGKPERRIHLPNEGTITHVSEHHIGFRNNEFNFTLFEAVE
jgi:sugar lactone lactonase YvrE